jgi:Mg2+/Co2+ transporter CorB
MKKIRLKIKSLTFLVVVFLSTIPSAYAYLDPGTGSMLLQVLIGGMAATLLSIKVFWKKIKDMFIKIFSRKNKSIEKPILDNTEDKN